MMYTAEFTFRQPSSVGEAVALMAEHEDAKFLAGGHSLIPLMKQRLSQPDTLIDISSIAELKAVDRTDDGVRIGALATHEQVASAPELTDIAPVVAGAADKITGGIQVSNFGTIGGNIAHADPGSDHPAGVVAADATIILQGPDGERSVPAEDFFRGTYMTDLAENELVTQIEIPETKQTTVGAYAKKKDPASGFAIVGVGVHLQVDGAQITSARVASNGLLGHAVRLPAVEDALAGESLDGSIVDSAPEIAGDSIDQALILDDNKASATYRQTLLRKQTRDALETATNEV